MPVRSLRSSVLKWPTEATVHEAVLSWAERIRRERRDVVRIGYFGSYARGDWGVGSDLDLIVVVEGSELPFDRRGVSFDKDRLPVPADLLVYTRDEWETLLTSGSRFARTVTREAVWL
jgi:uncharacterized protein